MRGEVVPTFLWEDVSVDQFFRPERLYWYILVSGKYRGTRWDWVVGPFEDEQPQNQLEYFRKQFLTGTFPEAQRLDKTVLDPDRRT